MERLKGKKLVLGTLLIAFLVFFVMPPQVHAQLITDIAGGVIARFAFVISYIIAMILGAFMSVAAFLASIALNLNYFVISKSNSLVGIGWSIVRDVANLGFVIVIIVMAFATIVRFERYGYQKILPKLIAAAILINFSLSIAGVFVDFANILTHFFFDRISQDPVEIAGTIAGAFNPQKFFIGAPDPNASLGSSLTDSLFLLVAQPVFTAVFLLVATFTILVFAFLLLLRFLHLTFLLIIAPIVWLFWVIPELSSKFKDWWSDFFKWLFFAPAASFFMYLALRALKESPGFWGPTQGNQLIAGLNGLENIFIQGAQMVVLVGIMLGGLIISQKMGVEAAGAAVNWAGKAKGKAQKWATLKTKQFGQRALTGGVNAEGKTKLEQWGAKYGKIPLVGRAITGVSGLSSRAKADLGKRTDEQYEKAKARTTEDNVNILNQATALMPPEQLAGRGIRVAEKGKWGDLNSATQQKVINSLKQTNKGLDIQAYRPDLVVYFRKPSAPGATAAQIAQDDVKSIETAMSKYVPDATKLDTDVLSDRRVATNLKSAHLTQLANNGTDEQKQTSADTVKNVLGPALPSVNAILQRIQSAKQTGNTAALQIAQTHLNGLKSVMSNEEKKALDTYQIMQSNVNWQPFI